MGNIEDNNQPFADEFLARQSSQSFTEVMVHEDSPSPEPMPDITEALKAHYKVNLIMTRVK